MKINILKELVLLALFISSQLFAQQTVGTLLNNSGTFDGYTLFTARHYNTSYLINNEGRKINEWTQPDGMRVENCRLLDNGQLIRSVNLLDPFYQGKPGAHGKLELVNWDGSIAWTLTYADNTHILHHDVVPIKQNDGSYHFLTSTWDVIPASTAIANGRNPNAVGGSDNYVLVERIIEFKPVGANGYDIVWEWSAMDHLVQEDYPSQDNYITNGAINNPQLIHFNYFKNNLASTLTVSDWMHVSGLDYNPVLDQIVIANHGFNELIIIDHSTTTAEAAGHTGGNSSMGGDILYRWGNSRVYDVTAPNHFQALHSPHWIPDNLEHGGKIMILNNGFNSGSSSIDIITPPVDANDNYITPSIGTAFGPQNLDWSYSDGGNFHTKNMGNGQRLPNGNTLINEAVKGRFFEIDSNENIVWEYRCPTISGGPMAYDVDLATIPTTNQSGDLENEVFRIYKYPTDYSGFIGQNLTPDGFVELNNPLTIVEFDIEKTFFSLHPNPTQDFLTISTNLTDFKIEILSLDGAVIMTKSGSKYMELINVSHLPSGVVIIKVTDNLSRSISIKKVVIL